MKNWSDAATRYREKREATAKATKAAATTTSRVVEPSHDFVTVAQTVTALERFLNSADGIAAKKLLTESRRHIIFGEERDGSYTEVYYLDGEGLGKSFEAAGMWVAYATPGTVPAPQLSTITARQAIEAAINPRIGGKQPEEVMPWLRAELDQIANHAPER